MNKFFVFAFLALLIGCALAAEVELPLNTWTQAYDVAAKSMNADQFYIVIPEGVSTRELVIKMQEVDPPTTGVTFDPDLYVKIGTPASRTVYDASDISDSYEHTIVLTSDDYNLAAGTKVYMGVYAWSAIGGKFRLRIEDHGCRFLNCGGPDRGLCDPIDGTCVCNPGFTAYPMCNAQVKPLTLDAEETNRLEGSQVLFHTVVAPSPKAKAWLHVNVKRTSRPNGSVLVAIRKNGLPTERDNIAQEYLFSFHSEVTLLIDPTAYSAGTWYVAVMNGRGPLDYSITATIQYCENNCSGNGTCNPDTSVCTCDKQYKLKPDCSVASKELRFYEAQSVTMEPWEQVHYTIPVSKAIADAPLEIGIHLKSLNKTEMTGMALFSSMYLNYDAVEPTPTSYAVSSPQPPTWDQTFYLPDTKLVPGEMQLLLQNGNSDVAYELSLVQRTHCPPGCENHGFCNGKGECVCNVGFIGGSCGISTAECDHIVGVHHGVRGMWVFFLFMLFMSLSAGVSAFIFAKFFYVETPSSQPAELQYDPLAV